MRHLVQARDRRDERAGSGGQHDVVAGELLPIHHKGFVADKPGIAVEHGHVVEAVAVLLPALGNGIDALEYPAHNFGPANPIQGGVNSQMPGVASLVGHVSGVHEHL